MFGKLLLLLSSFGLVCGVFAGDFTVRGLKLNHKDGFYKKGEEIVVTGKLLRKNKPAPGYKLRAITRWESVKVVATKDFPCDGKPFRVSFRSDKPGWVYFAFQVIGPDGKVVEVPGAQVLQRIKKKQVAEIGAMIAPEEIRPAEKIPEDFDEFWKEKIARLEALPMNPQLEKIDSGTPGVDL